MASPSGPAKTESSSTTARVQAQTQRQLNSEPRQPTGGSNFEPIGSASSHPSSQATVVPSQVVAASPPQQPSNTLPLKEEILLIEPQKQILYLDAGAVGYMADFFAALRNRR